VTSPVQAEDEFDAADLIRRYGSPLFVISERRLREDFRRFAATFSDPRIETTIAYSVKTNYLPAVCSILRSEGAWAEVVSGMEYELCRSLGFPPAQIIFNGPHKTDEDLTLALTEGALVNIDNFDELDNVGRIAATLRLPARIGIRISFHFGAMPWTKFGFSDDNGDSQKALEKVARNRKLRLELLHNHGGTFVLVHALYATAAERLINLGKRARALGLKPKMVDFGGGYPSSNACDRNTTLPAAASAAAISGRPTPERFAHVSSRPEKPSAAGRHWCSSPVAPSLTLARSSCARSSPKNRSTKARTRSSSTPGST